MTWRARLVLRLLIIAIPLGVGGFFACRLIWANSQYRAGQDAAARRDFASALHHFEECLGVWASDAEVHLLAARAARRAGSYATSAAHLDECRRLEGASELVGLEGLMLRAQQGDLPHDVEAPLLGAIRADVLQAPLILEALIQGYLATYRLNEAMECANRLLEREPDHVRALLWRGWIWEGIRRFPEAEADYRRALGVDPDDFEARLRLAEVMVTFKRSQEAAREFEHLVRRQPQSWAARFGLARCQRLAGKPAQARAVFLTLQREKPNDAAVLRELGQAFLDESRPAEAEAWLRRAIAADRHDPETYYSLSQCLYRRDHPREAEQIAAQGKRLEGDLKKLGDLNEQIGKDPRNPDLRFRAGAICLRNGQASEGLRWLNGALQIDRQHVSTHKALAEYYAGRGQREQAEHHRRLAAAK